MDRRAAAFADDIASDRELGAAVAVYHRGRPVVDLWGGWFDAAHERPYAGDTIQVVFSTGKAVLATAIAIAVERGWLDYDEAVSRYWPEFAAHGKQHTTVTQLLSHQCGLICPDDPLTLAEVLDWDLVTSSLADTAPDWPTGSGHGYHAITFGWLAGELLRRADPHHRTPRRFVADEIAKPLGLDLWIGLPRQQRHRVTPIVGDLVSFSHDPVVQAITDELMDPESRTSRAYTLGGTFEGERTLNRRDVQSAEVPAVNTITDARSLARMLAAVDDRGRRRPPPRPLGARPGAPAGDAAEREGSVPADPHLVRDGLPHRRLLHDVRRAGQLRSHRRRWLDRLRPPRA